MRATLSERLFKKLGNREYRAEYAAESVRLGIAHQIRALRDQRGWSQEQLAKALGKPQSVVSRFENPDYGKLTVQSLNELAAAFDVGLVVRFVNFAEMIVRGRDVSPAALAVESFSPAQFRTGPIVQTGTQPQTGSPSVRMGGPQAAQTISGPQANSKSGSQIFLFETAA